MAIIRTIIPSFLIGLMMGCSPATVVKPLEKGETRIGAHIGGPGILFAGAPIPMPLTSVQVSHGLDTNISLSVGLHTTSLLFGVGHLEAHMAYGIPVDAKQQFGLTLVPGFHAMADVWEGNFKVYPDLQALGWWQYGETEKRLYTGIGTWIEFQKVKAHGEIQQNDFLPWWQLGHVWERERMVYQVEAKYLAPFSSSEDIVVDYISPRNRGAVGVYFSIARKF